MADFSKISGVNRRSRGGPREFVGFFTVSGYQPASGDIKNWPKASPDDRIGLTLMHDLPGLSMLDDQGQPVTVFGKFKGKDNDRQHNVFDMAKGKEGKAAMTPRNSPILRVEGVYNAQSGEIEVSWMNRVHPKMDPTGATAYVNNWISVSQERTRKGADGKEYAFQDRFVALPESAIPFSMFGAAVDDARQYLEGMNAFKPEEIDAITKAMDDFRSGDADRMNDAFRTVATMILRSVDGLPGNPGVVFRGMDEKGAAGHVRVYRQRTGADGNYELVSVEEAVEKALGEENVRNMLAFALESPEGYWDAFPVMHVRTGGTTLPSSRLQSAKTEGRVIKDVTSISDDRFYKTHSAPNDDGRAFTQHGFSKSVMGIGRRLDTDPETGESMYTGSFYAMDARPVQPFSTNYALDLLPTDFMNEETLQMLSKLTRERQKNYVDEMKAKKEAAKEETPANDDSLEHREDAVPEEPSRKAGYNM